MMSAPPLSTAAVAVLCDIRSPGVCAGCGENIVSLPIEHDNYNDDRQPARCGDGCGGLFHEECLARHSQDCFDDHASAAYRAMPRRYMP